MRISVLAVGTRMPDWVQTGVAEYQKRFPRDWRFDWIELPLGHRGKTQAKAAVNKGASKKEKTQTSAQGKSPGLSQVNAKAIAAEGEAMLAAINPQQHVIALDLSGKSWSTEQLSQQVNNWQMEGQDVCLLIGGPDGLSPACLQRANQRWSLSDLTLPHPLVRILLAEQLYRSWSLLNNHPYHK
jgi:23S rRNA (pseudouridine1915-N3)-methyltransferase